MEQIFYSLDNGYIVYENIRIEVIVDKDQESWFHAKHTAKALGYKDYKDAIKKYVDNTDIQQMKYINAENKNGHPQTLYMSEPGLYGLILRSKMPKAKIFANWLTHVVLPSIKKYGIYKLKKEHEVILDTFKVKVNQLEKQNVIMKDNLKKECFPCGAVVYALDYSKDYEGIYDSVYRIGMTDDLNKRIKIYNTHHLHKRKVEAKEETTCPAELEKCIHAMLYKYRFKDRASFYICSKETIEHAFATCINSVKYMSECNANNINQQGGRIKLADKQIDMLKNECEELRNRITQIGTILSTI